MKYTTERQLLLHELNNNLSPYYESETDDSLHLFFKHEKYLLQLPHFHESYEFVYILKGEATFHIANNSYRLTEGDICFCDKFKIHSYDALDKNNIEALCLVLGKEYCHHFFQQYPKAAFYPIMANKRKNQKIFSVLQTWFNSENQNYLTTCAYTNLFLETIISEYGLCISNRQNDNLAIDFISYINEHYHEDISLASIANAFGYTREYFSSIFNKLTGQKFSTFLNLIRIQKAIELIHDKKESHTIATIAQAVGYKNLVTFYRNYNDYKKKFEEKET